MSEATSSQAHSSKAHSSKARLIVRKAAVRPDLVVDTVILDHAARAQAHAHLTTAGGLSVDLTLERALGLEDGEELLSGVDGPTLAVLGKSGVRAA